MIQDVFGVYLQWINKTSAIVVQEAGGFTGGLKNNNGL
jgi:hypothetical protein